ncbi:MAG: twin-arginine translocase subunit TatC [Pseudomonadota bacterium]
MSLIPQRADAETDAPNEDEQAEMQASAAPLLDHLMELRQRLIVVMATLTVTFVICFSFSRQLFDFLIVPFVNAVSAAKGDAGGGDPTLYFAPLEFFFTRVRLAIFAAIAISSPMIAYQVYAFVAPGLYRSERKAAVPFLSAMPFLFAIGASLVYFVLMPFVMRFAVGFEAQGGSDGGATFELLTRVGDYLSLITTLILAFGFAFQLPVFLTLLASAGLISPEFLTRNRKVAVVAIFIVAAFLTPPDPFSQIVLGLSIIALYEASVVSVRIATRSPKMRSDTGGDTEEAFEPPAP